MNYIQTLDRSRVLARLEAHFVELTDAEVTTLWAMLEARQYPLNIFTDLLDTQSDT
jgi:hypothetical protein